MTTAPRTLKLPLYSPRTSTGDRRHILYLARNDRYWSLGVPDYLNLNPELYYCWADVPINPNYQPPPPTYEPPPEGPIRILTLQLRKVVADSGEPRGRVLAQQSSAYRASLHAGREVLNYTATFDWWTYLPFNRKAP